MLLGIDVGGTFTDAVLIDGARLVTAKTPTTPDDQSLGVITAIEQVLEGRAMAEVELFAHGMTVATNALLEGAGARTALVATAGFTDLVELGRQARPHLYRLCEAAPAPLVPPALRVGAPERCGPDGVVQALENPEAVADAVAALAPESVAVCLLHGYRHTDHERRIGEALRTRLGNEVHISLSHEVTATFREFERAVTTEVDAALSPLLADYLGRLGARAREAGLPEPRIMQSSGGLTSLEQASEHASLTVLSGPAGGAAAAQLLAARTGRRNLLCFDMGGTSCDVCVVEDGRVRETASREVGGRPLALPMVDIHTVGAGGGSIAWIDPGGALRVGPRSAGADPGPACYGRGGTEATVTDAHVALGRFDRLAGITLEVDAARHAVGTLADDLGIEADECARGILRVADAEMVRALRVMTVERGVDPRDFALLAFGGAGGLHAAAIADELGIGTVLVPAAGGVLSALGLAAAERRVHVQRSVLLGADALSEAALMQARDGLRTAALRQLGAEGPRCRTVADARYRGQSHELTVAADGTAAELREAFECAHAERYGYREEGGDVELVTLRVTASAPGPEVDWEAQQRAPVRGPQTVMLDGATVRVPEGWHGEFDATGTLVLER